VTIQCEHGYETKNDAANQVQQGMERIKNQEILNRKLIDESINEFCHMNI
jgi:hypothetical protein